MSQAYIPAAWREQITARANAQCEYCQTQTYLLGMPLQIDHIIPQAAAGETVLDNLCLACPRCNQHKGTQLRALDPITNDMTSLFNPRFERWGDHFRWSEDGAIIHGLTACGRASIMALQMNNPFIVRARLLWVKWGHHPPPLID